MELNRKITPVCVSPFLLISFFLSLVTKGKDVSRQPCVSVQLGSLRPPCISVRLDIRVRLDISSVRLGLAYLFHRRDDISFSEFLVL